MKKTGEEGKHGRRGYNLTVVKHQGTKCKVKNHNAKKTPLPKKPQTSHLIFPSPQQCAFSGYSVPMKYKTTLMVAQVTDFI